MTPGASAARPSGSGEGGAGDEPAPPPAPDAATALRRFLAKTATLAEMEARKLRNDPIELFTRAVQPVLWLLVFGEVVGAARAIPTEGGVDYVDYLAPGVLAQSVLFISIFYGIAVIWERDLGILYKFLASPTPRAALVLGKALSAGLRGLSQAVIIYLVAAAVGVGLNLNPLAMVGVAAFVLLGAAFFATLSVIIASFVQSRDRFMGIGQMITMPLFFASNAIYPVSLMPPWLQAIALVNPLTYQVDALRGLMLAGGPTGHNLGLDALVMCAALVLVVLVGGRVYERVGRR